jgi:DNA-binding NarL/FixJ family response regulator
VCAFRCLDRQFTETATDRSFLAVLLEPIAPTRFALRKGVSRFKLSGREVQVIQALTIGLTDKAIAIALGVKPSTIRAYLRSIRTKLDVSTRTAIVHKVYSVL